MKHRETWMAALLAGLAVGCGAGLSKTTFDADRMAPRLDGGEFAAYRSAVELAPGTAERVRFVVVGDVGKHSAEQKGVAGMIRALCGAERCDFMLFPGDNLYNYGVEADPTSEPSHPSIERLKAILAEYPPIPKCLVLGNHDWGLADRSVDRGVWQFQVLEQQREALGIGCHSFFVHAKAGPVSVWGLDTEYMTRRDGATTQPDIVAVGAAMKADAEQIHAAGRGWQVVFGHHAYLSTGVHGDAGDYDRRPGKGADFERFLDEWVIGKAQLYAAGHDHHLEFYDRAQTDAERPTALMISGSGAKCRPQIATLRKAGKPRPAYLADRFGFAVVDATADEMTVRFYEYAGAVAKSPQPVWSSAARWVDGAVRWTEAAAASERVGAIKARIAAVYGGSKAAVKTRKTCPK